MILPDFILPSRQNQTWLESGLDSLTECLDKKYFELYPYPIEYQYNSRGFRDAEWPNKVDELKNSIWCIGDSFTVGLGCPITHTWPYLLQQQTRQRTINVSMDGASNLWIARKTIQLIKEIDPKIVVLHWSYSHRRELDIFSAMQQKWKRFYIEIRDATWPEDITLNAVAQLPDYIQTEITLLHNFQITDEDRRVNHTNSTDDMDMNNLLDCIKMVELCSTDFTKIIHSFIPEFINNQTRPEFFSKLSTIPINYVGYFDRLDHARDGHHYDLLTSRRLVDQIVPLLD